MIYFYEYMTETLVGNNRHPLVIVDWFPINGNEIFQILRASILMGERTLTLYEKYIKNQILTQSTLIETYSTNYSRASLKIASRLFYPTQFSKPQLSLRLYYLNMVPEGGLEPPLLSEEDFEFLETSLL